MAPTSWRWRYDYLGAMLGSKKNPAIGAAIGMDRVVEANGTQTYSKNK